jgi:hypothetical protein
MDSGTRFFRVIALTFLACLGPGVHFSEAQQIRIESFFPRQLPPGQATIISVAVPSRDAVQAAEISPSAGVKVSGIKLGQNIQGTLTWSELTIDVASEAAPGDRALVLVMPTGRTAPVTIMIPSHVPRISELRILSAQANQPTLELQFAAVDRSADLGDSPYVWFTIGCDGDPLVGVINGKVNARDKGNGVVHATIPNPRTPTGGGTPATGECDLQVRVSDSGGIDSNTLQATVDFKN